MPKVQPIQGEALRYRVESESQEKAYFVDLSENEGEGACDCADYTFRVSPARNNGKKIWCKHLRACYGYFGWEMAKQIARKTRK